VTSKGAVESQGGQLRHNPEGAWVRASYRVAAKGNQETSIVLARSGRL